MSTKHEPKDSSLSKTSTVLDVVQFTDSHILGDPHARFLGVDTFLTLQQVVKQSLLRDSLPSCYLLTGDLSQDETEESYRRLEEVVRSLKTSVHYIPGNHDSRQFMQTALNLTNISDQFFSHFVLENWLLIMMDSLVEHEVYGRLENAQLEMLSKVLQNHVNNHVLISLHHHVMPSGSQWLDQNGLRNTEDFWNVIDCHKQVKLVLSGHIHQQSESKRKGVYYLTSPSTCIQFARGSEKFKIDLVPPGYRWMKLYPDGLWETGVEFLPSIAAGLDMASSGY